VIYYQSLVTTVRFFLNLRTTTFRALPIIPHKVSGARNSFATLDFMNKLVLGNLLHRPLRVAISVLAVAIEVIMILSITGVFIGQVNGSRATTLGVGADMVIQPPNASFITALGGAAVPAKIADVVRKLPHVTVVAPVISQLKTAGSVETILGIDYDSYNALRPFKFLAGGPFQGPNDVIIDDLAARRDKGYRVGDTIQVFNRPFRISGIVANGKGGRKFIPIRTLGAFNGAENNASFFYVKTDNPANEDLVRNEIHKVPGMSEYEVHTVEEIASQMTPDRLPGFNIALRVVISIAFIVGFLVIFQSMYTAVLERTREIGILKSLGASKLYIVNVVLRETSLFTVAGILVGLILTFVIKAVLSARFPTLPFPVEGSWMLYTAALAFIGSLLGALYPAWKAAQKDPIDALAYE
jgi:putative ABC transport system permease protein